MWLTSTRATPTQRSSGRGVRCSCLDISSPVAQTGSRSGEMNRAALLRRAHYDQCPSLEKLAPVTVIRSSVLAISVSHRCNHARTADRKLHFLVRIRLESTICIHSFHADKRQVLSVRL